MVTGGRTSHGNRLAIDFVLDDSQVGAPTTNDGLEASHLRAVRAAGERSERIAGNDDLTGHVLWIIFLLLAIREVAGEGLQTRGFSCAEGPFGTSMPLAPSISKPTRLDTGSDRRHEPRRFCRGCPPAGKMYEAVGGSALEQGYNEEQKQPHPPQPPPEAQGDKPKSVGETVEGVIMLLSAFTGASCDPHFAAPGLRRDVSSLDT